MSITSSNDLMDRFTGDDYSLPPVHKLEILIEDAEDILFDNLPDLEERSISDERLERKIKRVVSGAVIRHVNTAAEGIGSHQLSVGGMSEMVSYVQGRNRNSIYFTVEELDSLREKKSKPRLSMMDLYDGGSHQNKIIGYSGKTGIYSWDKTDTNKNNFHS